MSSEDWTVLESNMMDLVITDILILSKKDRAPDHFTTVCLTFMIHRLTTRVSWDVYCLWLGYTWVVLTVFL